MKKTLKPYHLFQYLIILAGFVLFISVGNTWQVYPAWLAVLIAILILVLRKDKRGKILVSIVLFVLLALTAVSLYLFPMVTLPLPSGKYQVGVRYKTVQTDRDESMTPETGDTRKLYLKIWYPAKNGIQKTSYIEGGKETINHLLDIPNQPIPAFLFHHITKTETNSYLNAPIEDGPFPLVTFSHGFGMWHSQSTSLMEELASQGMIVASIAHSHQTMFAAENENTIVTFENFVSLFKDEEIDTVKSEEYELRRNNAKSKREMDNVMRENISDFESVNEFVQIWSMDISATIDMVVSQNRNPESFFYQKLDTNKIGASGMSFGGAAAVESTLNDSRVKTAINMDGWQFGNFIKDTTDAKILFMEARRYDHEFSVNGQFFDRSNDQVSCLMFNNTAHMNFSDISLVSPLFSYVGILGEIDGALMVKQTNKIVTGFFKAGFINEPFQADRFVLAGKIILPAK